MLRNCSDIEVVVVVVVVVVVNVFCHCCSSAIRFCWKCFHGGKQVSKSLHHS